MAQDELAPQPPPPAEPDRPAPQQPPQAAEPEAVQPAPAPAPPAEKAAERAEQAPAEAEPRAEDAEAPAEGVKLPGKGEVVDVTVRRIAPFGAFVRLSDGRKGLIHISQVADEFVNEIKNHLKVGQVVRARITAVSDDGKVDLSIKKAKARPKPERPPGPRRRKRSEHGRAEAKPPKRAQEFHVNPLADVFVDVEKKLK